MPATITLPTAKRGRWRIFTSAPHRMMFFTGAVQTVLIMLFWLAELLGRSGWWSIPLSVIPPVWAHVFLMLYGLFPFFIFGFLFTVYPRWLRGPIVPAARYSAVFVLLVAGVIVFYAGLFTSRVAVAAALTLLLTGWGVALHSLLAVYRKAPNPGLHERLLNIALTAGFIGIACFLVGVLHPAPWAYLLARETGLWLFLVPVVFLVAHRMIPFFSQSALIHYIMVRPTWGPPVLVVCVVGHVLFELNNLAAWRFLADAPLAIAALHHFWIWQFRRSFHARLLAMLHIAFLWLGLGMTLYAVQSIALLVTGVDYFGRVPLHALGIGFFTGMVVAMASRVTLGHSGHTLEANDLTWGVLLGVNIAAVMRLAAEYIPGIVGSALNILAATIWLVAFLVWGWQYAPIYLRPRLDRKPG
ncbi:MAG: NnrS family protein [Sulfuricaulis sp.]|uniref:NnrS family protein n=1 Tax=Sulfuricaulis sp. TaxID=2003553 RepID=UPI0034A46E15